MGGMSAPRGSADSWPKNHLRAPEDGNRMAALPRHLGIPHLGVAAGVHGLGFEQENAFPMGAEEIALEFDGGEALGAVRQVGEGGEDTSGVRQGDDRGGM